ncbi:MAG: hypothetical protein NC209_04820 [Alistipes sp.]|nr:hypothetical protein [Alistipes senegalensis]MCM1250449.1 hypothetical protein [Alistipes sp.]
MKKLIFLVLAAATLCCCEKESETTGKLVLQLYGTADQLPMNLVIRVLETNDIIHDLEITRKETSIRLNPGNYSFRLYAKSCTYSKTFQIVAGRSVTFMSSNIGTKLITN